MLNYETLRRMQRTYLAASKNRVSWEGDRSLGLAEQISILAGHLADLAASAPVTAAPSADDVHVAVGCRLFSNPNLIRSA